MKKEILIFKTSISSVEEKRRIAAIMNKFPETASWTVDLEDCDKVLRVCAERDISAKIIDALTEKGVFCEVLTW
ncbi:hypothetical protein [Olivibacter sp. XZL3]|uniref:hypothetical protein n=1 Tax=Olivibacter sp. XZL3 TaxID=1735116 RepID=UPI001065A425|nr:hypothetical protein [Olivibacter sp. XZL3]